MYYFWIQNNVIDGKSDLYQQKVWTENRFQVEVSQEVYNNSEKYIWDGENVVLNPNYEKEQEEKEQERINNLTMTALDFINVLKGFGLTAIQINAFIETNVELKLQLFGCQNVWCGVAKQIFAEPITIGDITITSEMVEQAFKDKTGENDEN